MRVPHEACIDSRKTPSRVLLVPDQLLHQRQALAAVRLRPGNARPAALPLSVLPSQVVLADACVVAGPGLGRLVLVEPRSDPIAELELVSREVEIHGTQL